MVLLKFNKHLLGSVIGKYWLFIFKSRSTYLVLQKTYLLGKIRMLSMVRPWSYAPIEESKGLTSRLAQHWWWTLSEEKEQRKKPVHFHTECTFAAQTDQNIVVRTKRNKREINTLNKSWNNGSFQNIRIYLEMYIQYFLKKKIHTTQLE